MGWIYWLRFPNGKGYVGQTRGSIRKRYLKHANRAARGSQKGALYAAWRRYGAPECVPLFSCPNDELNEREMALIAAMRTLAPHGYNVTTGGDCDLANAREKLRTPEVRAKQSANVKRLWSDPEYRRRQEAVHVARRGTAAPNRGLRHDAKQRGDAVYWTGKPCIRGHVAARYTSTGICCVCLKDRNRGTPRR